MLAIGDEEDEPAKNALVTFVSFFSFGGVKLIPFIIAASVGYKDIDVIFSFSTLLAIISCMLLGTEILY